jgi:hypothetical protein
MGSEHPIYREYRNLDLTRGHRLIHDGPLVMKLGDSKRVKVSLSLFLKGTVRLDWISLRCYHWKGLEKGINRNRFFYFWF